MGEKLHVVEEGTDRQDAGSFLWCVCTLGSFKHGSESFRANHRLPATAQPLPPPHAANGRQLSFVRMALFRDSVTETLHVKNRKWKNCGRLGPQIPVREVNKKKEKKNLSGKGGKKILKRCRGKRPPSGKESPVEPRLRRVGGGIFHWPACHFSFSFLLNMKKKNMHTLSRPSTDKLQRKDSHSY